MSKEKPLTRREVIDIVVERMKAVSARTSHSPAFQVFQMQDIIRLSDPITQNQWYDAWDGATVAAGAGSVLSNVRVHSIALDQATANEDIEVRIVTDDFDGTAAQTFTAATNYEIQFDFNPDSAGLFAFSASLYGDRRAFLFEGRSVQIMYRKTSAAGANDTTVKIIYSLIP